MNLKKYITTRNIRRIIIFILIALTINIFINKVSENLYSSEVFRTAYKMNITHLMFETPKEQFDIIMVMTISNNLILSSILIIIFIQFIIWFFFKLDEWLNEGGK